MNDLLISVIIPVFNVRPFLQEALDSVINQTYNNIEIIIIDDGSSDGSEIICNRYAIKDNRIRIIHQDNKGLSSARNAGLNIMTGDAIVFLDSDDAYHPQYIELMVNTMIREMSDLVICRYNDCLKSTEVLKIGRKRYPAATAGIYERVAALNLLAEGKINHSVWNKLYSKQLWVDIRFPEGHVYEDIDTTYKIINRCNKVCIIEDSLYMHAIRVGSIASICTEESIKDCIISCIHFESFIKNNIPEMFSEEHYSRALQYRVRKLVRFYLQLICSSNEENKTKKEKIREKLKKRIIEDGHLVGTGDCEVGIKICYWLICYCSWLLNVIYPLHKEIRSNGFER